MKKGKQLDLGAEPPRKNICWLSASYKPKPDPSSYRLAATHFDAQSPWNLTDTPKSTPLMEVSPR